MGGYGSRRGLRVGFLIDAVLVRGRLPVRGEWVEEKEVECQEVIVEVEEIEMVGIANPLWNEGDEVRVRVISRVRVTVRCAVE